MKAVLLWLETGTARILELEPGRLGPKLVRRRLVVCHAGGRGEGARGSERFFQKVAASLRGADEILLVGPGPRKRHFHDYLAGNEPQLAGAVVGMEDSRDRSDEELLAFSRGFLFRSQACSRATR